MSVKDSYMVCLSVDVTLIKVVWNEMEADGLNQDNLGRMEEYLKQGLESVNTLQAIVYEEGP